jgi:hypothetical protein
MRAYYFGNLYMSSIQQGIQALHTTAEMFIKYDGCTDPREIQLREWAGSHKTVILKQAGYSSDLNDIVELFVVSDNPYPWSLFHEEGVDGALTCVGIVLPEKVYSVADEARNMPYSRRDKFLSYSGLTSFELAIVGVLMETNLAR